MKVDTNVTHDDKSVGQIDSKCDCADQKNLQSLEARVQQLEDLLKRLGEGVLDGVSKAHELAAGSLGRHEEHLPTTVVSENGHPDIPATAAADDDRSPSTAVEPKSALDRSATFDGTVVQAEAQDAAPQVEDKRVKVVHKQWNGETSEWEDIEVAALTKKEQQKEVKDERAFIYRKILHSEGGRVTDYEVELEDTDLKKAVEDARHNLCPGFWKTDRYPMSKVLPFPFEAIVWNYDVLTERSKTDENEELRSDLALLLQYVAETPELVDYFECRRTKPNMIAFKYLWTLFPPGTEVVAKAFLSTPQLFGVQLEHPGFPVDQDYKRWQLWAWCYDHNGTDWVRVQHKFVFERFEKERPIDQQTCYPIKYYSNRDSTGPKTPADFRNMRKEEGERFRRFASFEGVRRMVLYEGTAVTVGRYQSGSLFIKDRNRPQRRNIDDDGTSTFDSTNQSPFVGIETTTLKRPLVKDEVIVDAGAWYQQTNILHLGDMEPTGIFTREDDMEDEDIPIEPEGDYIQFCPPRFWGWALKERTMAQFKFANTNEETVRDPEPYEKQLELDEEYKKLLRALIDQQDKQPKQADVISGKGNSLVILLHGPPGVGKTLTAETVAKATGKPLLVASVADIGLSAEDAEDKLQRVFAFASRWEAILLIDEADAFLEERSGNALPSRNALVSVMLRVLEYYNGTIILTTNRLASLDAAVQSRIHLAVRYQHLQTKQRENIFATSLDTYLKGYGIKVSEERRDDLKMFFKENGAEALTEEDNESGLNGREIRNLVRSAVAVALYRQESLNTRHLREVLRRVKTFKSQLREQTKDWNRQNAGRIQGGF